MRTAVILCAGLASRLRPYTGNTPKQLLKVAGREILSRTVELLRRNGVEEFLFVVNRQNKGKTEAFVRGLEISYRTILNGSPERENGYSLYLVRDHVEDEEFILTMGDHIYSEEFIGRAVKGKGLIVDEFALYTDREEATKVLCEGDRIKDIGKDLKKFNGYDTGFFVLHKDVFKTAQRLVNEKGKVTLSEIIREARVECTFVSGEFWTDIDTPEDIERARRELIKSSVKGAGDGLVSRYLNRRFSLWLSEKLVDHITPNQATWITFLLGVLASLVALFNPALGGVLYQLSSMADGIDGEIARASLRTTKFGGWLDSILDRYADFLFLLALALWLRPSPDFLMWVLFAVFGSLMVSYTTERFRGAYCEDAYQVLKALRVLLGKRDERVFLIMLFCLLGWVKALFVLLTFITNLRVILTIYLVWKERGKI